jgi:hypothetical protein
LSIEADPLNKENKKRYALGMVNLIAQWRKIVWRKKLENIHYF